MIKKIKKSSFIKRSLLLSSYTLGTLGVISGDGCSGTPNPDPKKDKKHPQEINKNDTKPRKDDNGDKGNNLNDRINDLNNKNKNNNNQNTTQNNNNNNNQTNQINSESTLDSNNNNNNNLDNNGGKNSNGENNARKITNGKKRKRETKNEDKHSVGKKKEETNNEEANSVRKEDEETNNEESNNDKNKPVAKEPIDISESLDNNKNKNDSNTNDGDSKKASKPLYVMSEGVKEEIKKIFDEFKTTLNGLNNPKYNDVSKPYTIAKTAINKHQDEDHKKLYNDENLKDLHQNQKTIYSKELDESYAKYLTDLDEFYAGFKKNNNIN